jgi:hypothetical protein
MDLPSVCVCVCVCGVWVCVCVCVWCVVCVCGVCVWCVCVYYSTHLSLLTRKMFPIIAQGNTKSSPPQQLRIYKKNFLTLLPVISINGGCYYGAILTKISANIAILQTLHQPFKLRVKSHLPIPGIIKSSPYFPR